MTAADWCALMMQLDVADEQDALAAYADWLEEEGEPRMAHAARRLGRLVLAVSDELERWSDWTHADFCRRPNGHGGHTSVWRLIRGASWRGWYVEQAGAGLVALAGWHYPAPHPANPALSYVERMLPLDCASVLGSDPAGEVRSRFARRP